MTDTTDSPLNISEIWAQHCDPKDVNACLEDNNFSHGPSFQPPLLIHMIGLPASGKSTVVKRLNAVLSFSIRTIAFDDIMENTKGYDETSRSEGKKAAFQKWEIPARTAGYKLLQKAADNRENLILDHSGADPKHVGLIRWFKKQGYTVRFVHAVASKSVVRTRATARNLIPANRFLPLSYIDQRAEILKLLLPKYHSLGDVYQIRDLNNKKIIDKLGKSLKPIVGESLY